ncbi:MAG: hypothetical protein BZY75_00965 [SAR202 cluster bacterium Io17-Chloro-G7]|nr:MAG: hypothetical protein BZY75_00965 [SAR202 cluster bacterium Io17-Chloro-G7]
MVVAQDWAFEVDSLAVGSLDGSSANPAVSGLRRERDGCSYCLGCNNCAHHSSYGYSAGSPSHDPSYESADSNVGSANRNSRTDSVAFP